MKKDLELVELIERFQAGGAVQSFTYTGTDSIIKNVLRIEENPGSEYTFVCLDEARNYCFHSIDSIKGYWLSVGDKYVFTL